MISPTRSARRVAVLDVGKTNVKAVLVADGQEAWSRTMPNHVRQDGPYPHFDTDRIEKFLIDALADLWRTGGFDAVSITTHGASGALLRGDTLALPVLDYEHDGPDAVAADYDRVRPAFSETFSPRLPGGLNLGAQLFWQARRFPDAVAVATSFVTYPQYWAFRLTGVAATEVTSLGAHTDLWAPREGGPSSLVATLGWQARMAPIRSAFDVLGPIRPDLARRIGFDRPVPVACGIHDSNASLLPHLRADAIPCAVVSTGTWVIVFAPGGALDGLDPARDTLANVDAWGRPVPSARFMGGREFELLVGSHTETPPAGAVRAVLDRRIMVLPTFVPGSGPFPQARGRWSHAPDTLTPDERTAAATLYEALTTATCLDLVKARGDILVEGPFAANDLFCDALERLAGRRTRAARSGTGTSAGAAQLAGHAAVKPSDRSRPPTVLDACGGLQNYASTWRAAASRSGH